MGHFIQILLCFSIAVVIAQAAANSASLACGELSSQYPNNVAYAPSNLSAPTNQSDGNFVYTVTHYWNSLLGELVPSCVFYPTGAADVSFVVQILLKYPDVPWAAKSGGHNPNKDWSSVQGGVLISFRPYMQSTTLNADGTADVGPGSRWSEAVSALEPYNKALVGARLGDVGVGGYTLGGGLSFLSSQYGMACDSVIEFEVVLADGTIATINEAQNTDLFFALKGGGNQFAIVTSFKMRTVPISQVWGGFKIYTFDKASAILNATNDFTANYYDNKAAIIPTFVTRASFDGITLNNPFTVFFFYNGPTVPSGVFGNFDDIPPLIDQTKVQSYADLLVANNAGSTFGLNTLIRGQTIPCIADDDGRDVLQHQLQSFLARSIESESSTTSVMVHAFAMQPLPTAIPAASLSSGSQNTFGFDIEDGDRIWIEFDVLWVNSSEEVNLKAYADADSFTQDIVQYTRTTYPGAVSTHQTNAADQYLPLFLNDKMFDQATSLFYKPEIYKRLKKIQRARDPGGFFSQKTGGAKFV